jgi:hypothetical protein
MKIILSISLVIFLLSSSLVSANDISEKRDEILKYSVFLNKAALWCENYIYTQGKMGTCDLYFSTRWDEIFESFKTLNDNHGDEIFDSMSYDETMKFLIQYRETVASMDFIMATLGIIEE